MNSILSHYKTVRQRTETLCKPLTLEDYTPQSAIFASPPKWHIGHTTWFFEEMILKKHAANYKPFDNKFSYLFNSYYNSLGDRLERHNRGLLTRPSVNMVKEYRAYVDQHMLELLYNEHPDAITQLTQLGLNHEQQHQELLITDLKYTFSLNPIYPILIDENYINHYNTSPGWIAIDEGIYSIGNPGNEFCFDNELSRHRVFLEPYEISNTLVTYGEYMEFIVNDGYKYPQYWLDEGWSWIVNNKTEHPLYWKLIDKIWHHYTLSGLQKIDLNNIMCHISFYEASAFAMWKECRLPTEFEWEVASNQFKWGARWEWTNSAYLPYPNFKIQEGAVGEYNGKFMINQMVLRGASSVTSKGHSRNSYRNFFPADTQWQFSGIRLAK